MNPEHEETFATWLAERVMADARGTGVSELGISPSGKFWAGRLDPERSAEETTSFSEKLAPCAMGIRVRPADDLPRTIRAKVRATGWCRSESEKVWRKSAPVTFEVTLMVPRTDEKPVSGGDHESVAAFAAAGLMGLSAQIRVELESGQAGPEVVVTVVNTTEARKAEAAGNNPTLFEVDLDVETGPTIPFQLETLEASFRHDRSVAAYGINSAVEANADGTQFRTMDAASVKQSRRSYWDEESAGPPPPLQFSKLADDPLPALRALVAAAHAWGEVHWADSALTARASSESWSDGMLAKAREEAAKYADEVARLRRGLETIERDEMVRTAFQLANRAFARCGAIAHDAWRPFQVGFFLVVASSIGASDAGAGADTVDTLWFPTGGGKTETYLLVLIAAAFADRLRGKKEGITAWTRFPLRMLSLQQVQRFADVFAAAELVRREENIGGRPFTLGYYVGENGTPNAVEVLEGTLKPAVDDPEVAASYRVLVRCPFCGSPDLQVKFDRRAWLLNHRCNAEGCAWGGKALPFRVVDQEIYRTLPTVVLGTLDKAANLGLQAAMRGFYAPPLGVCPVAGHGFTYPPRGKSPTGCLFPDCREKPLALEQDAALWAPGYRLQDELHLLRDSLGAVASHYEALLDHLQEANGSKAKILGSSATLAGHDEQVRELYRRRGRVFPMPGPRAERSLWCIDTGRTARIFMGVAPRGTTVEWAKDEIARSLLTSIKLAADVPDEVAREIGVPSGDIAELVTLYGTTVVYSLTVRDAEAAARSMETELALEPENIARLSGSSAFEDVRRTIVRLEHPEPDLKDRIRTISATSMMSHGVDVDRLNVMIAHGQPLSTAEFIQSTARVGRAHPGLVFMLHRLVRERDGGIYRAFPLFVRHAERLIDPVPITSRSRRVLERTFPGIFHGRILGIHEPQARAAGIDRLTTPAKLAAAFSAIPVREEDEVRALEIAMDFQGALDGFLRTDLEGDVRDFFRELRDPTATARFTSELFGDRGPMRSLRDVEEAVPVIEDLATRRR